MTFLPDDPQTSIRRRIINNLMAAASLKFTQHRGSRYAVINVPIDLVLLDTHSW